MFGLALSAVMASAICGWTGSNTIWLDTLDVSAVRQDWQTAQANRSVQGNPLSIAGRTFDRGIGTHAKSSFELDLLGAASIFSAFVGVDDEMQGHPGSVEFRVFGDGHPLWSSTVMRVGDKAQRAKVNIKGIRILELRVTDAGDGNDSDHADWADAFILADKTPRVHLRTEQEFFPMTLRPGWNDVRFDRSLANKDIRIGDRTFPAGIGTRTGSDLVIAPLSGGDAQFECWAGVDAETPADDKRAARFRVLVDGVERFASGPLNVASPPEHVAVPLGGAHELRLVATPEGSDAPGLAVDWASPAFSGAADVVKPTPQVVKTLELQGSKFGISAQGDIVGLEGAPSFIGTTRLAGCVVDGEVAQRALDGGGIEFAKTMSDPIQNRRCAVTERFVPAKDSVRWEVEIRGQGEPWSTAIDTCLEFGNVAKDDIWTAWSDPDMQSTGWKDPLVTRPFGDRRLWYGAPFFREDKPQAGYCPVHGDTFSIPVLMVASPEPARALSVVLSPEDRMLDLIMTTDASGRATFSRIHHRICEAEPLRFAMDLVPHEKDWRAAMGWIVKRYPNYFDPPNPKVHAMAGCGAYSSYEGDLDAAKFKAMAFRINWKASFDFPYMGMFLPPVATDDERWPRFDYYTPGKHTTTSIRQMNDYAARMQAMGFHVLSYFNVTEFGTDMKGPEAVNKDVPEADLWKNANDFAFTKIEDGILYNLDGKTWGTWGGAVAMDPGGKDYQEHLIEQAKRHIEKIPASEGICIDRMDWLRFFNPRADDGVSWHNGGPVRSLYTSWRGIMDRLAPLMHQADKVIFVNNHLKRVDLLRDVDGIYCEFGHLGPAINMTALLGARKPVLAWTSSENDLKPDPDAFFQRYLYLGMYPTAPLPGNDHTMGPSEWAEKYYLDYGPLMDAMRGRTWVLLPDLLRTGDGGAKANLFQVPGGFVMPVIFAGDTPRISVTLPNPSRWLGSSKAPVCEAIHPGIRDRVPVAASSEGADLVLNVPLVRGCAMVCIKPSAD